eukprot:1083388-Pyramimonas_sp.AAC.2
MPPPISTHGKTNHHNTGGRGFRLASPTERGRRFWVRSVSKALGELVEKGRKRCYVDGGMVVRTCLQEDL